MSSKALKLPTNVSTETIPTVGNINGNWMPQKIFHVPAPSTLAASKNSSGIRIRAARKSIITIPTFYQNEISESVMRAVDLRPSQGLSRLTIPIDCKMLREIPQAGFKISFQTNPMITTDKIVGVKMMRSEEHQSKL